MVGVSTPRYSRSFVPRYTVHERAFVFFNSTFFCSSQFPPQHHTPPTHHFPPRPTPFIMAGSGWLSVRVKQAKGRGVNGNVYLELNCPKGTGAKQGDGCKTEASRGPSPSWEHISVWKMQESEAEVTFTLHEKDSITGAVVGLGGILSSTKLASAALNMKNGNGEDLWVPFLDSAKTCVAEVRIEWRFTYSAFTHLFEATDDNIVPVPPEKYSQGQLQYEIGRISAHGMNALIPLFWLLDLWYWKRPYESACVLSVGVYAFYFNLMHVVFPASLSVVMILNFLKKFAGEHEEEKAAGALGFLGTMNWIHETLKYTQNYLKMTNDAADATFEMFNWENQDMSTTILGGLLGVVVFCVLLAFPVHHLLLAAWVYMFTYFPLGFYLPQMYTAMLPQNFAKVASSVVLGKDVVLKKATSLHISSMLIPKQEKKKDGATYYEVHTKLFPPKEDGSDGHTEEEVTFVVWHRFSEYVYFRAFFYFILKPPKQKERVHVLTLSNTFDSVN